MKILKYKKVKSGMYQLYLDNFDNVLLHEEIILKYNLLIKKEVNKKDLDKMILENKKYIGYDLAVKHLTKKQRSVKEIKELLKKEEIDSKTIDDIVDLLIKQKYIDDNLYAKLYITDKINLSNDGPNKIKNKLIELGIDIDIIENNINIFTKDLQIEKIEKIINKQMKTNRNKSSLILKNKISDYLYNLGYDRQLINNIINNYSFNDDKEIIKKEYDKIYKKLSRKYSGSELEFRVKQKMYQLGFRDFE